MLHLSFESGEESLSVRKFSVEEGVSALFSLDIEAVSPRDDMGFEAIVGQGAALRVGSGEESRLFRGVCSRIEQVRAEPTGLSTYAIRIVPALWLLTQRRNHRLFQHRSVVEIARTLLAEWKVSAKFRVEEASQPKLELRVQYGESDFDFFCRLLEEAGLAFVFPNSDDRPPLLITDDLHAAGAVDVIRTIAHVDDPSAARERPHATALRLSEEVTPGRFTIRDADFRRSPAYELVGTAISGSLEDRYEQYHYRPGSFLIEGQADARHDEKEGHAQAERGLRRARSSKRVVSFRTNVVVAPGMLVSIVDHPRSELAEDRPLLVTSTVTKGSFEGDVWRDVGAGFSAAATPWLPPTRASKPRVQGVQSAVVVGPQGQEIHTDALGRVRVQFPWDRDGHFDEQSSCWLRVSQGWAGGAYGMIALPRVGQEVLVEFVDGNPDQPIVVGRVYNSVATVPYKLPENATVTTWKSASSPGGEGSNEILFEDAKGGEQLFVQAERDLEKLVKRDESASIGNDRSERIGRDETIFIGNDRRATVGAVDTIDVGTLHAVTVKSASGAAVPTGSQIVDGRITLTTGQASLTLEGPDIILEAAAGILLKAAKDIELAAEANITARADVNLTLGSGSTLIVRSEAGDLVIQGGPFVRINPEIMAPGTLATSDIDVPIELPPGVDLEEDIALAEAHRVDPRATAWFDDQVRSGGAWDHGSLGPEHAAFASFHYGLVGRALGFPEGALLHQSGARRRAKGDSEPDWGHPGNGLWGGTYPYGADPRDQEMTRKGFAFYARRYG
jgi:type VI secretion system secreted protein VgrG